MGISPNIHLADPHLFYYFPDFSLCLFFISNFELFILYWGTADQQFGDSFR